MIWYLGGFAALVVAFVLQVGPSAWASAWQVRHFGSDRMLLDFLPGFGLLLLPLVFLRSLPGRPAQAFLCGLQDALWPRGSVQRSQPLRDVAWARLRRTRAILAGMALACVLATCVGGWLSLAPGTQLPGSPLPRLTLDAAAVPDAVLPGYARLTGAVPRPDAAWEYNYTIRFTRYRDTFVPLTAPDWRPGDPVAVLRMDRGGMDARPGPAEGSLSRGLPGWQVSVMRESGLALVDLPVVLTREMLNGTVPGPDGVGALVAAILGASGSLGFGAAALGFHRAYRRALAHGA